MFRRLGAFFLDILEVIVFAVGIFFFVYLLIMRPHKIKGESMTPNYPDGEYILTEKVSYYLHKPERGDVVVLKPPQSVSSDEFIKRIIGLPGERVAVRNGHVFINNGLLTEPYLKNDLFTSGGTFLSEDTEYTVPPGKYLVFGDNRPNSSDSRFWGPVPLNLSPNTDKEGINGRAWIIYWPLNLIGVVKSPKYQLVTALQ